MILKNFINHINILNLIKLFIFSYLISQFIIVSKIRQKFFYFILLFIIISSISLYYSLDGIVMLFIVSELSIILIFITMFSQLYSFDKKIEKKSSYYYYYIILLLLLLNLNFYSTNIVNFKNFYSFYSININDFYYIYNCYFEKQLLTIILISILLTLYSLFFILLYFNFKKVQNKEIKKKKKKNILRKQNLMHQSNYKTTIRSFQNK